MLLTSQIKELGAILQKLIKTWINPGRKNEKHDGWRRFGDADRLLPLLRVVGNLGLGAKRKRNEMFSQELEMRKERKPFKLC